MDSPLSIITAIHNGLPMNRLFWKALTENTQTPFELIIIDNHSTDGSEDFFKALGDETRGQKQEVIYLCNPKISLIRAVNFKEWMPLDTKSFVFSTMIFGCLRVGKTFLRSFERRSSSYSEPQWSRSSTQSTSFNPA